MLFDAFSRSDNGIDIRYRTDGSVFNLRRLQLKTKVKTDIVNEFLFADDCALNAIAKANIENSVDKFSMTSDNFGLTIITKRNRSDAPSNAWKTIHRAQQQHQGTITKNSRKVHLPRQHPLWVYPYWWQSERQTRKSECDIWPTQQECVESERHFGGNKNQGITRCRSYHPPLWLWNVDNLSIAYKEAKRLSHDIYEEDSRLHMPKSHPRHGLFNTGFSSQHLHHLDAITASLGASFCPHER